LTPVLVLKEMSLGIQTKDIFSVDHNFVVIFYRLGI